MRAYGRVPAGSKNDGNSRVVQLHPQGPLYCAVINRDGNHLIPMTQIEGKPLQNQLSSMFENVQRGNRRALRGFCATTRPQMVKIYPYASMDLQTLGILNHSVYSPTVTTYMDEIVVSTANMQYNVIYMTTLKYFYVSDKTLSSYCNGRLQIKGHYRFFAWL